MRKKIAIRKYIVSIGNLTIFATNKKQAEEKADKMISEGWIEISDIMEDYD